MLAALTSLAIFATFTVIGSAVLTILNGRRSLFRHPLVTPAIGIATILIPTLFLSRIGLPVRFFAPYLTGGLMLLSIVCLAIRRPPIPWSRIWPFALLVLVALALTGRPLFEFGFNWLSFSNDDMLNYSLGADRFASFGYYTPPPLDPLSLFRGYDFAYWILYAVTGERGGNELLLAVAVSIFGMRGFHLFMPFMLAGYYSLIWGASAMLWRQSSSPMPAVLLGLSITLSALTSLGVLYQLLAQVFGLCLLTAIVAFLFHARTFSKVTRDRLGELVTGGILVAGLLALYPEVVAFGLASIGFFVLSLLLRRRVTLRNVIVSSAIISAIFLVALQGYATTAVLLIRSRVLGGQIVGVLAAHSYVFPYYLLPSGLANFWNLLPIAVLPGEPWLSISIAFSFTLSLILLSALTQGIVRNEPASWMTFVMLILGLVFFWLRSDFVLYKLAMYLQPFAFASIVALIWRERWRVAGVFLLAVTLGASLYVQQFYVNVSRDVPGSPGFGFVEVPHASYDRLLEQLDGLGVNSHRVFVSDTPNQSLAKYEIGYVKSGLIFSDTREFRSTLSPIPPYQRPPTIFAREYDRRVALADKYTSLALNRIRFDRFDFQPRMANFSAELPSFRSDQTIDVLTSTERQTILNRRGSRHASRDVVLRAERTLHDWLSFVESSLGKAPGPGHDIKETSLFQLEPDFFYRAKTMSALGRYLLFHARRPSKDARLVIDLTASLNADGSNRVPPVRVVGRNVQKLEAMGRGSARLVSRPIDLKVIDENSYFGVDLGRPGHVFPTRRSGLMWLFGLDVNLDPRLVVAFGRDISLIPDSQYRSWIVPQRVENFPEDLTSPTLEYSGLYEDGWSSEDAFVKLAAPIGSRTQLLVRGMVPLIDSSTFTTDLDVFVDAKPLMHARLILGDFELGHVVKLTLGRHVVRLHFSRVERLPGVDSRLIAAKLSFVGFTRL